MVGAASAARPPADFAWGAFFLRWLGAVLTMTAVAVAGYLFIHEYLYDWSEVAQSTRDSPRIGDAVLQRAQETVRLFLDLLDPSWFTWALALGAPLLAFIGAGWRIGRVERIGGRGIAESLGAEPVTGGEADPVRRVLHECVASRAQASGIAAPALYLMGELDSVCAATFGSSPEDAVLVVSKGAAQRLDPVALEALIAWQLAALDGGRLHRDARIAGFLHPLLWPWLLADAVYRIELRSREMEQATETPYAVSPLWDFTRAMVIAAMVVRLMLRIAGFPGLAMGRLLQREALAEDLRQRDRAVAAALPDPEALAAALYGSVPPEMERDEIEEELFAAQAEAVELAHAFFAEPAPVPQEPRLHGIARRLASHEGPLARLRRFAPRFDAAAYAQRAARIAGDKNALGFAHGVPDASMLSGGASPSAQPIAPAARAEIGDPAEEMQRAEFFLRFERPVLEMFRTPQGASRLLRSAVAPAAAAQDALRPALERLSARERRWVIERGLGALREAPENVRAAHLRAHRLLIEMDRRVTLEELTDWLYVERGLGLVRPVPSTAAAAPADVAMLRSLLAGTGGTDVAAIEAALLRLRAAAPAARVQLVRDCLETARADGKLSEDESELLRRLCFVFDLSPALLAAPAAKTAAPAAASAVVDYPPPEGSVLQARPGAGELPVSRPCGRCGKRAGQYRNPRSASDVLADWTLPALFCIAMGLAIFWLEAPHRSLRPNAWLSAAGLWLLASVALTSVLSDFGLFLEGVVFPRWVSVLINVLFLVTSCVILYRLDHGLGVIAGSALFWMSMLTHALTRKMAVPGGTFYFCRGCGLTTSVQQAG